MTGDSLSIVLRCQLLCIEMYLFSYLSDLNVDACDSTDAIYILCLFFFCFQNAYITIQNDMLCHFPHLTLRNIPFSYRLFLWSKMLFCRVNCLHHHRVIMKAFCRNWCGRFFTPTAMGGVKVEHFKRNFWELWSKFTIQEVMTIQQKHAYAAIINCVNENKKLVRFIFGYIYVWIRLNTYMCVCVCLVERAVCLTTRRVLCFRIVSSNSTTNLFWQPVNSHMLYVPFIFFRPIYFIYMCRSTRFSV